jgi:hypothetical protein
LLGSFCGLCSHAICVVCKSLTEECAKHADICLECKKPACRESCIDEVTNVCVVCRSLELERLRGSTISDRLHRDSKKFRDLATGQLKAETISKFCRRLATAELRVANKKRKNCESLKKPKCSQK